ncbi:hypothetical protein CASFOL_029021 [Castilleja foliolosa]|uniref:B3 domain-containing protein Os07g0563300-like n=1 Tax=Castilleja foliolosa TaxID=1961234 RepID=A0ABD3CCS1_9LAMI
MSSSTTQVCFNSNCKEESEKGRSGWRRRTGEFAHLCDRCANIYEDGKFCETFHLNAPGWRCCESCGKQIHCGCIVSFHMFVLLDAGGIECLTCARKSYILTPNPAWPPPLLVLPSQPERMKDLSVKPWNSIAGSAPVPWHQTPNLFNGSVIQSSVPLRIPFEMNASGCVLDRLSAASPQMKTEHSRERLFNGNLSLGPSETLHQNGNTGLHVKEQAYHPFVNDIRPPSPMIDSPPSSLNFASSNIQADDAHRASIISEPGAISIIMGKQRCCSGGMGSCGEPQICSGKARAGGRGRKPLLPRYHPQISEDTLQLISDSKSFITPLFEKMLSASDAGRIGRLVVPKKCAEAYFPQISQPEGLPLKVQDVKGKEWVFQFRFWPNNNSRMYVLEGISPCIQSMQLQAGDVVTFSRMDPEGKLVMGCRKAPAISSSEQGDEVTNTTVGSDASNLRDVTVTNKTGDDKPITQSKRKCSNLGAKKKRLRIVNEDTMQLSLTWREAQALMRPPAKIVPSVFLVEGCEFEEFEGAAPVIGRPTIFGTDHFKWVQCEDCFKWRKVPEDALLSSRWICSENTWDPDRSQCSSAEELTNEQLEVMLPTMNKESSSKTLEITEEDPSVALEGLDKLANLAIKEENQNESGPPASSSENTTKHPRHKPGCSCIVCLQPPSGKGSKHEKSCECIVCSALKRRAKTLTERREKKQWEKETETSGGPTQVSAKAEDLDEPENSPMKGQIDLNIQPEREEEVSLGSGVAGPMSFAQICFRRMLGR